MGILEAPGSVVKGVLDPIGSLIANPFSRKPKGESPKPDFPDGFQIVEIVDGQELTNEKVTLLGNQLPMQPFTFGGSQRIKKDFYPGHSEPTVQIFGPEETNITLKGKLKDKRYKDASRAGVSTKYQELIDAIRIRGNLCRFKLGEWKRYGLIETTVFRMNTLREIEYEITLSILGFNPPLGCKIVTDEQLSPFSIKKDLIAAAEKFNSDYSTVPESMPASIADLLNDAISDLSSAINAVTGFVDKVLDTAEDINRSANRALGLIKNARANVSLYTRRVGFLALDVSSLLGVGTSFGLLQGAQRSKLTTRAYTNSKFIVSSISDTNSLSAILARLEAQFKAFSVTVPASRYMVKTGDTLQKLAVKYYNDANQWKRIYDHNKLTSTSLTVGRVLEIPKV